MYVITVSLIIQSVYCLHALMSNTSDSTYDELRTAILDRYIVLRISQFNPFLVGHISKCGNSGKENISYLSKTTFEELIQLMAQKVHALIVGQVKSSGYFSLSVDSTPGSYLGT